MEQQAAIGLGAALKHRIGYLNARQGVVASNIANASTPNYLSRDVQFSGALKKAQLEMKTTNSQHIAPAGNAMPGKVVTDSSNIRNDGNSVEVTQELQKLADIQLEHRMMTQLMSKYSRFQTMALGRNGQ